MLLIFLLPPLLLETLHLPWATYAKCIVLCRVRGTRFPRMIVILFTQTTTKNRRRFFFGVMISRLFCGRSCRREDAKSQRGASARRQPTWPSRKRLFLGRKSEASREECKVVCQLRGERASFVFSRRVESCKKGDSNCRRLLK